MSDKKETMPIPQNKLNYPEFIVKIKAELENIVSHSAFKNSVRCIRFLRYIVEYYIQNKNSDAKCLKERTIGIDVFGRPIDYDNTQDPIVRATASEVRKRLAQYYLSSDQQHKVIIKLNPGSYIPEIHLFSESQTESNKDFTVDLFCQQQKQFDLLKMRFNFIWLWALAVLAIFVIIILWIWINSKNKIAININKQQYSINRFWQPLLSKSDRTLVCVGLIQTADNKNINNKFNGNPHDAQYVSLPFALMISRLAIFYNTKGLMINVKPSQQVIFDDLQQQPSIIIGGLNNNWSWTKQSAMKQRYFFATDSSKNILWIADKNNPLNKQWSMQTSDYFSEASFDYAIIARMSDLEANHPRLYAGGLSEKSTIAAVDCLLDTKCIDFLINKAPKDWEHENVEWVVLIPSTTGHIGSPQIQVLAIDIAK